MCVPRPVMVKQTSKQDPYANSDNEADEQDQPAGSEQAPSLNTSATGSPMCFGPSPALAGRCTGRLSNANCPPPGACHTEFLPDAVRVSGQERWLAVLLRPRP